MVIFTFLIFMKKNCISKLHHENITSKVLKCFGGLVLTRRDFSMRIEKVLNLIYTQA